MAATVNANDLSPELRRKLDLPRTRTVTFGKQQVRQYAIRVLATVAGLTQQQRDRVLKHAAKLNRV